jgi:hypothetical protein
MRLRRNHEWAEGGDGGRGRVYEAYEVKIKGKNCAVFCFAGKRKILFIYL